MQISNMVSGLWTPATTKAHEVSPAAIVAPQVQGIQPTYTMDWTGPIGAVQMPRAIHGLTPPPDPPPMLSSRNRFDERIMVDQFRSAAPDLFAAAGTTEDRNRLDGMFSVLNRLRDAEDEVLLRSQMALEV